MNSRYLLLALFSLFLAFSACKDADDDQSRNIVPKIKKMTIYMDNDLSYQSTFTYDAEGRIAGESRENSSYKYSIRYDYLPGMVIVKYDTLTAGWEDVPNDTLILNDKGLKISESTAFPTQYDTQGYLVQQTVSSNKVPYLYSYQVKNGNTVRWTIRTGQNFDNIDSEHTYEFLPNSVNTIGNENMGITFYGKQDKNLMAKATCIDHTSNGIQEFPVTFSYELDARGRVAKQSTEEDPGFYTLFTYYE